MNLRAASLFFAFAFATVSTQAQGPPGGPPNIQSLASDLAALTARVAKLEGQIVAADLVGTYALHGFQTELRAASPTHVASYVFVGTLVLAADGTGSFSGSENGHRLIFGSPNSLVRHVRPPETQQITWTYADGIVTVPGVFPVRVAAGGRVLILAGANGDDGTNVLIIFTRLQ